MKDKNQILNQVAGRALDLILLILLLTGDTWVATADTIPLRPNVIFILADDLGYGDLGCYGRRKPIPRIDRMAEEGTRFTQFYSGSPVCAPSRCCLMTGKHNGRGRVRDNIPHGIFLQPDDLTVAEVLKQAGYRTAAIGKWSLGDPGTWGVANYQGFDEFFGHLNQDQAHFYYPDHLWENDQVVLLRGNRGDKRGDYTQDLFTEKALASLKNRRRTPSFFIWRTPFLIGPITMRIHPIPSQCPRERPPIRTATGHKSKKTTPPWLPEWTGMSAKILDRLKELGIDQNTLVFFTSDNGPSAEKRHDPEFFNSNGGFRGVKREVYEGGNTSSNGCSLAKRRFPTPKSAIRYGRLGMFSRPSRRSRDSLLYRESMGYPCSHSSGRGTENDHDFLYWDYGHVHWNLPTGGPDWRLERDQEWSDFSHRLFNLSDDTAESKNVSKDNPAVVEQIELQMQQAFVETEEYPIAEKTSVN